MMRILLAAALFAAVPGNAHASDMGILLPVVYTPVLIVGAIGFLLLRWRIKKNFETKWPRYLMLGLFCVVSVPGLFMACVAAPYLASQYWDMAAVFFGVFLAYGFAAYFGLLACFGAGKPAWLSVRRLVAICLGFGLLLAGGFAAQEAYRVYQVKLDDKRWDEKRDKTIMLYASAPFTPDTRCRAVDDPKAEAAEKSRLYGARRQAEEDGKKKILAEVGRLRLKNGMAVADALAADPQLAARAASAVEESAIINDMDCAVWRSTCTLWIGLEKSVLAEKGLDIVDPGRLNYDKEGRLEK